MEGELTHCEACSKVKSKWVKFRQVAEVPATHELERVHVDTTGPFPNAMLSGAKYMFMFVDAKKQKNVENICNGYISPNRRTRLQDITL